MDHEQKQTNLERKLNKEIEKEQHDRHNQTEVHKKEIENKDNLMNRLKEDWQ
jgi:hypothetical protein